VADRCILFADSAARRLEAARGFVRERKTIGGEWWVVAPTRRAADAFVREGTDAVQLGVRRFSWAQWARAFGPPSARRPVSALAWGALATRATQEARAAGELEHFGPVASAPHFTRVLLATLEDLTAFEVDLAELEALGAPGRDLARLGRRVNDLAEAQDVTLPAAIFREAEAPEPGPEGVVVLDVAMETPLERAFFLRMTASAAHVAVASGDDPSALAERLSASVRIVAPPTRGASELEAVRSALFVPEMGDPPEPDGSLALRSCRSEAQETIEIARTVLDRAAGGEPFDRMAVVLRSPKLHQPLLQEAFQRAEIPAFFTRGVRRPSPAGRAFLALLSCAEENLSAGRFAEYLSFAEVPPEALKTSISVPWVPAAFDAPQLAFDFDASDPGPNADEGSEEALQVPLRWEQWLVDAAVVGTAGRWRRRLDGLLRELEVQHAGAPDEAARMAIDMRRRSVEGLQKFALPLVERLDELRKPRPWPEWLGDLEELAVAALRRPAPVLAVLAELRPLSASEPVTLFEVRRVLEDPLGTLRPEPSREPYGSVWVGTPEEALGRSFASVFAPGLSEGVFPARFTEDPLLPDALRKALDPAFPGRARHRAREERAFQGVLSAAERFVLLTSARLQGARGRPQVPSFHFLEAARRARGGLDAIRALARPSPDRRGFGLGWEVPTEPSEAIDAIEYDLTVASSLAELAEGERRGISAYAARDPMLHRALTRRGQRWRKSIGPSDGGVVSKHEVAWSARHGSGLATLATSPTGLQHFAACPYRFWLHTLVRIRDDTEPLGPERLDARTRGAIFHEVQFRYVSRCRTQGLQPSESFDVLDAVWSEVSDRYREDLAPALPSVFERELDRLRTDLRGWWRHVAGARDGFEPTHAELSFGLGRRDLEDPASWSGPVDIDGFPLRGSIDLVERDAEGRLRVTDYKTGRPPAEPLIATGGGEALQPLIYVAAAEQMLNEPVLEGRLAYCTLKHGYRVDAVPAGERPALTQLLATVDAHVREGFFPAVPREGACGRCDYRVVCGHREEERARRKDRTRLAALDALRSMP